MNVCTLKYQNLKSIIGFIYSFYCCLDQTRTLSCDRKVFHPYLTVGDLDKSIWLLTGVLLHWVCFFFEFDKYNIYSVCLLLCLLFFIIKPVRFIHDVCSTTTESCSLSLDLYLLSGSWIL